MAEWSMAVVLKTTEPGRVPGVRIPLSPPASKQKSFASAAEGQAASSWSVPMGSLTKFPQTLDSQLRFAIAHKRLIQLGYNGRIRIVEPHDYGVRHGSTKLLAYQRGEWRSFDFFKIESLTVLEKTFRGGRAQPHQHHQSWDVLYARVTERDE